MKKEVLVLEPSTNTHSTRSKVLVESRFEKGNTVTLRTHGGMVVEHGQHRTVATENIDQQVIKIVQQEHNPILGIMQNSSD